MSYADSLAFNRLSRRDSFHAPTVPTKESTPPSRFPSPPSTSMKLVEELKEPVLERKEEEYEESCDEEDITKTTHYIFKKNCGCPFSSQCEHPFDYDKIFPS